jgi:hypothetical protein
MRESGKAIRRHCGAGALRNRPGFGETPADGQRSKGNTVSLGVRPVAACLAFRDEGCAVLPTSTKGALRCWPKLGTLSRTPSGLLS